MQLFNIDQMSLAYRLLKSYLAKYFAEGSDFLDFLEITTAVVVSAWSWQNVSPCIDIMLIFFIFWFFENIRF